MLTLINTEAYADRGLWVQCACTSGCRCARTSPPAQLSAFGVAVAACLPLAMLLAVELLNRALKHHRAEIAAAGGETRATVPETSGETTETDRETMIIRAESGNETNPPLHLRLVRYPQGGAVHAPASTQIHLTPVAQ